MGVLLLRYGELSLKGQNRLQFCRRLRGNVRACLDALGLESKVWQDGHRIYVEVDPTEAAVGALRNVFGIVSLSPVRQLPLDLHAMADCAVELARQGGLHPGRRFRVESRRADKSFSHTSPEIDRFVGAAIQEATGAQVDLSHVVDLEIGIEVHSDRALIYGQVIPGPGGLPLGSQGRVVALLSTGIDSPVAIWLMMKRGCAVTPIHFSADQSQTDQVHRIVDVLNRYAHGCRLNPVVLSHAELLGPVLARLKELRAERWTCLICKRLMLSKASDIAVAMQAHAVISGDSMGQVASQTLSNLEAVSSYIRKPIFRPLIGLDKTEITALARRIGTYDISTETAQACPFLPRHPRTQARVDNFRALLQQLDFGATDG